MQRWTRQQAGARRVVTITLALVAVSVAISLISSSVGAQVQNTPVPAESGTANNGSLEITAKVGFGKLEVTSWNGSWVPFRITVTNQGPPITGRLVVHTASNNGPSQARDFIKEIQLPTGAHQLHEITAYLNSNDELIVRIMSGDNILIQTTVPMQFNYGPNDQLTFAVVDTDPTTLNNVAQSQIQQQPSREPFKLSPRAVPQTVSGATPPNPPGPPQRRGPRGFSAGPQTYSARPIVIMPEDLPRDFVSYDMLDAVVLNDASLSQLSEEQARALRLWVASGGVLIVAGGADISGMRASHLDDLLPIDAGAASTATGFPVAEMTQIYGGFDTAEATLGMNARVRQNARTLLGNSDRPVVAERNYGNGTVRFLAINPKINPYRSWNGAKELWADLLWPAADSRPRHTNWIVTNSRGPSRAGRWGVQDLLFHLADLQPPSAKYVIFFLLAYVLLVGPVNYAVLRWRRKTDLAWLTIPAVVILFTIVSVAVAQISHGRKAIVADASLVQVHQADGITNMTSGLIVVPPEKAVPQLVFPGNSAYASAVFNGGPSGASSDSAIECERDPQSFTLRAPMSTRSANLFQYRTVKESEPPLLAAQPASGAISIKNLGDAQITKAVYLSADGVSSIFELAPGGEQQIALTSAPGQAFNTWYISQIGQDDESELFEDLAGVLDREVGGDPAIINGFFETQVMSDALRKLRRPLVLCFIEKSPAAINFNNAFKRSSKAFYVIHL